ncbi:MAG: efflux RND transporter periplasmic adaptor subunit [Bacteroidales bacterium]|nr:efflux RND transporter periplasmic adaptor subunit [Bacteroidales bacterium]
MNQNRITVMLLAAVLLGGCSSNEKAKEKAPLRVRTEVVKATSDSGKRTFVGTIEECEATSVSFTSMGVVKRVLVGEGQRVTQGDLIAEMDDTQARNMLLAAEAQMTQANDALERYTMLHNAGSLPEVNWVEIQSKVAQAKSQLELARKNLADCKLTAPVSGIVGRKLVGAGETALPSQAIVTILNIDRVKVKLSVPENEINTISANTASHICVAAANVQIAGGSVEKGVQADALTHTYDIRINLPNANHQLLPGMVASVVLNNGSSNAVNTILLPITSVQKRNDDSHFVWVVDAENKARRSQVTIGYAIGNDIIITSGLSEGNRVVVDGYQKLSEGVNVVY